ncbi:hypothetical protein EDD11_005126 [Mortierella claussenii]|nr:hypothetical protein EDD11_005126 [Mortierella claussenii]
MPPSTNTEKEDDFNQGQGFAAFNASRRRQPPPKLKKPVPHYRHLVRWNKNAVPESVEEQQMNQDLTLLRHALDLFLNSNMAECEAILAKGPVLVSEHRVDSSDLKGGSSSSPLSPATPEKAAEALGELKLQDTEQPKVSDDQSSLHSSTAPSTTTKSDKKSSSASSTSDGKKSSGKDKAPKAMYYELAKGIIQGLRALVTFDPTEIELGMKAFEQAIKTADKQRKGTMIGLGSVKAVGSFVVGTIGAGSFKSMSRVQKHAVSARI